MGGRLVRGQRRCLVVLVRVWSSEERNVYSTVGFSPLYTSKRPVDSSITTYIGCHTQLATKGVRVIMRNTSRETVCNCAQNTGTDAPSASPAIIVKESSLHTMYIAAHDFISRGCGRRQCSRMWHSPCRSPATNGLTIPQPPREVSMSIH